MSEEKIKSAVDEKTTKEKTGGETIKAIAKQTGEKLSSQEIAMIVVIAILVIGLIILLYPSLKSSGKQTSYSLEVVKIEECKECFDLALISNYLSGVENINIKEEKTLNYNSEEATKLIDKYNIEKVPAVVVLSRNIDKVELEQSIFRKEADAAIFDKSVPYLELSSGEIKGLINMKEIYDSSCKDCASFSSVKTGLERSGVKIKDYEMIEFSSEKGKEIVKENSITYLPSLLLTKNIEEYWWIFSNIENNLLENKDYYEFSQPVFPYKEISTGNIKGKVKATYITNKSCEECFNVTELKSAFQNLGVYIDSEKYVDISSSEGKSLLTTYNITAIPTVILSEEISDYETLKNVLEQVGIFENKKFVFKKLDVLNVKYQNIGG